MGRGRKGGKGRGVDFLPQCAFIPDPERASEKKSKTLEKGKQIPGLYYCSAASLVEIFLSVYASHYLLVLPLLVYIS